MCRQAATSRTESPWVSGGAVGLETRTALSMLAVDRETPEYDEPLRGSSLDGRTANEAIGRTDRLIVCQLDSGRRVGELGSAVFIAAVVRSSRAT